MQMKKKIKEERASMAVYVAIVLFSFLIMLTGIYVSSISVRKGQLQTILRIKDSYELNNDKVEEIYQAQANKVSYVQDGLMLHYDGINNTGNGHSTTATTWKDLTGNGHDIATIKGTINDDNIQLTGSQSMDIPVTGNFNNFTVEIVTSNIETTSSMGFQFYGTYERAISTCLPWSDNVIYLDTSHEGSNYQRISKTIDFDKTGKHTLTFRQSTTSGAAIYLDGNLWVENKSLTRAIGNITGATLGGGHGGLASYFWKGKIHSFRAYSKGLTQEEITQNYNIDKSKYGF